MRTLDAIARLSAFPATALIESAAGIEIKRAGVGMADFRALAQDEIRARAAALNRSQSPHSSLLSLLS